MGKQTIQLKEKTVLAKDDKGEIMRDLATYEHNLAKTNQSLLNRSLFQI